MADWRLRRPCVQVFGQVREVREIAERARDDHRLLAAQAVQDALEFAAGVGVLVAMERDGDSAARFRPARTRAAFLVAHRVAKQAAEQADVVPQRTFGFNFEVHDGVHS